MLGKRRFQLHGRVIGSDGNALSHAWNSIVG
jgi:hypothetical protein